MMRARRQAFLALLSALTATMLLLLLMNRSLLDDPARPEEVPQLARWLTEHPGDWVAAGMLTDRALDTSLPQRVLLWRSGHQLARYLAPRRINTEASFVRGGLFHWYELGPADRRAVLEAAAPLLSDPRLFQQLHKPLWDLTRDFDYLRRVAPRTIDSFTILRDIALAGGRFDDYRSLRVALRDARMAQFRAHRGELSATELVGLLPLAMEPIDEPLIRNILEELDRRTFDAQQVGGPIEQLAQYAIRAKVQPLSALEPLVHSGDRLSNPTRARLALALGRVDLATQIELTAGSMGMPEWAPYYLDRAAHEEQRGVVALGRAYRARADVAAGAIDGGWRNTCGENELCDRVFRTHRGPLQVTLEVAQSDEVPPYVEVYRDGQLVAEGEVRERRTFSIDAPPHVHRFEIRTLNRYTRNGTQRRTRLS